MKKISQIGLTIALLALLGACSAKVSGTSGSGTLDKGLGTTVTPLEGTWDTGCAALSGVYVNSTMKVQGSNVDVDMNMYMDSRCSGSAVGGEKKSGTFIISGSSAAEPGALNVDWAFNKNGETENFYDIFTIENDVAFFGDNPGKTAATRAAHLNRQLGYKHTVAPQPVPQPGSQPTPPAQPTTCVNLSGRWQMNSDLFSLSQSGCSSLNWHNDSYYSNPYDHTYVADGVAHQVPTTNGSTIVEKSIFRTGDFLVDRDITDSSGAKVHKQYRFYLTKRPCDLYNPNGRDYLTMEVYYDGSTTASSCTFWTQTSSGN